MPQEANATSDDNDTSWQKRSSSEEQVIHNPRKTPGILSKRRIFGPVDKEKGDVALLVHSFVTGLVDAASFSNWGVFVGMQTGNTVILGLSTAGLPNNPHAWATTLVSLGSFLLGAFVTFRTTNLFYPKGITSNRFFLSIILLIQSILILISAALVTANLVPHNHPGIPNSGHTAGVIHNPKIISLFPPLGFQSGMQIATSRLLGFNELPVNVLTSTYCDLMGDAKLFALHNVKRNRRGFAVVLLFLGALVSGWLMRSKGGLMSVLWFAGGVKFLVALGTFLFHPARVVD